MARIGHIGKSGGNLPTTKNYHETFRGLYHQLRIDRCTPNRTRLQNTPCSWPGEYVSTGRVFAVPIQKGMDHEEDRMRAKQGLEYTGRENEIDFVCTFELAHVLSALDTIPHSQLVNPHVGVRPARLRFGSILGAM